MSGAVDVLLGLVSAGIVVLLAICGTWLQRRRGDPPLREMTAEEDAQDRRSY